MRSESKSSAAVPVVTGSSAAIREATRGRTPGGLQSRAREGSEIDREYHDRESNATNVAKLMGQSDPNRESEASSAERL